MKPPPKNKPPLVWVFGEHVSYVWFCFVFTPEEEFIHVWRRQQCAVVGCRCFEVWKRKQHFLGREDEEAASQSLTSATDLNMDVGSGGAALTTTETFTIKHNWEFASSSVRLQRSQGFSQETKDLIIIQFILRGNTDQGLLFYSIVAAVQPKHNLCQGSIRNDLQSGIKRIKQFFVV